MRLSDNNKNMNVNGNYIEGTGIIISDKFIQAFEGFRTSEIPHVTLNEYHEGLDCISDILNGDYSNYIEQYIKNN